MNSIPPGLETISPRSASSYFLANPYATPTAQLRTSNDSSEIQLATRGRRLGAWLLDGLIFFIIFYFLAIIIFLFVMGAQGTDIDNTAVELNEFLNPSDFSLTSINLLDVYMYLQILIALGMYTLINGYLLHKRGQSLGKMMLNISIRDKDSMEVPPLSRILLKRYLIIDAVQLINVPLFLIVELVDMLSIFRQDKRMVHDMLANTVVIQVPR